MIDIPLSQDISRIPSVVTAFLCLLRHAGVALHMRPDGRFDLSGPEGLCSSLQLRQDVLAHEDALRELRDAMAWKARR
jgi:hypothetical protein